MYSDRSRKSKVVRTGKKSSPSSCDRVTRQSTNRNNSSRLSYEFVSSYTEDHKSTIFCVQFNHFVSNLKMFACTARNRVSIYGCLRCGKLSFLQAYADPCEDEKYFTCAWSYNDDNEPILAVAGYRGIIRLLNPNTMTIVGNLTGHGHEINDVKFHSSNQTLLVSASVDRTLRLWNVKTLVCVAIFGGADGHRDAIASVSFNLSGNRITSGGVDHAVKIWDIDKAEVQTAIENSNNYCNSTASFSFPTHVEHIPGFSTRDAHIDYIDCVSWFGEFIISKSCDKWIKFWVPVVEENNGVKTEEIIVIKQMECENCDLYFLKFSIDFPHKILTLGSKTGKIFVWNLQVSDPDLLSPKVLQHPRCICTLRHTALSSDGQTLIATGDDGSIWRWERN